MDLEERILRVKKEKHHNEAILASSFMMSLFAISIALFISGDNSETTEYLFNMLPHTIVLLAIIFLYARIANMHYEKKLISKLEGKNKKNYPNLIPSTLSLSAGIISISYGITTIIIFSQAIIGTVYIIAGLALIVMYQKIISESNKICTHSCIIITSDITPGKYQHFKGMEVEVLFTARHSETLEEMVIYKEFGNKEFGGETWVRPKKMFLETVEKDGKTIPRFRKI